MSQKVDSAFFWLSVAATVSAVVRYVGKLVLHYGHLGVK